MGGKTIQGRVFDVIRSELNRGKRPWLLPRELDTLLADVEMATLYKSLQYLRARGAIERVPGQGAAFRISPGAPQKIQDMRGRTPGSALARKRG